MIKTFKNEVLQDINVEKIGSYRMIIRYINKNLNTTDLFIRVQEQNSPDEQNTTIVSENIFFTLTLLPFLN